MITRCSSFGPPRLKCSAYYIVDIIGGSRNPVCRAPPVWNRFEDLLTAGGGVAKPTPSVVEGSERLSLGRVDRDDLVETACLEDLPDLIGQEAECELGVPVAEGFGGQEDGAKTGAADVDELLEIHDHRSIAFFDRGSDGLLELSDIGAVNASAHLGGQYTVLPFGRDFDYRHDFVKLPGPPSAMLLSVQKGTFGNGSTFTKELRHSPS